MNSEQLEAERKAFSDMCERVFGRKPHLHHTGEYTYDTDQERWQVWQAARLRPAKDTRLLGKLLAVIHRDGGHYQQEHGTSKAVKDAIGIFYTQPIATSKPPHCTGHNQFEYDCIDCSDELERQRKDKLASPRVVSDVDVEKAEELADDFDQVHGAVANHLTDDEACTMEDVSKILHERHSAALESIAPAQRKSDQTAMHIASTGINTEIWMLRDMSSGEIYFDDVCVFLDSQSADDYAKQMDEDAGIEPEDSVWEVVAVYPQPTQPSVPVEELRALIQAAIDHHAYWGEVGVIAQVDLEKTIAAYDCKER